MVERNGSRLQSGGKDIVSPANPPLTSRSRGHHDRAMKDMTDEERTQYMEKACAGADIARGSREPQSARALLEVNKGLVEKKKEEHSLARKMSREFIDQLLQGDQKIIEADKAKHASRRLAQQELARYYRSRIDEKEEEKSTCYRSKLDAGAGVQFFPYTEGEHINQTRKAQNALMREEMRGFLKEQRSAPGRAGRRKDGEDAENLGEERQETGSAGSDGMTSTKHPKFLTRPNAHMSRRIQDEHVRKALEDKVRRTKEELEGLNLQRKLEAQAWEEGLQVNDALRYDATVARLAERHKNAEYLRIQIDERKAKAVAEKKERKCQVAGYWGPEEKESRGCTPHIEHNSHLIKQMEANQSRRLNSRSRRIVQEKKIVDNSLAEITQEREQEEKKIALHREVLTTTWDSQRKIKEVLNRIESHNL